MNKKKKIPMRKCVATGEMMPKKELIRIVRTKEGAVFIDQTGKKSGRGAYLTKSIEAIQLAKQKNILKQHLDAEVDVSIYDEILMLIDKE